MCIKRCNDFGAGGVSVAIGELAEGVTVWLDRVPKKYEGLDGTELAISESQERMAVVVSARDQERFRELAAGENLEATVVAEVTAKPRLVMYWKGRKIVDISRAFLDTNGAAKSARVLVEAPKGDNLAAAAGEKEEPLRKRLSRIMTDLNVCSRRGLVERFDSSIGANTLLMPFGGKYQKTPVQAMAAKLPVLEGETHTCSVAAYGFNPAVSDRDPYGGAYLAVVESLAKLVAAGAETGRSWLSFQEYFRRLGDQPENWGKPLAALLGALKAQLDYCVAAIGGKDSMSGSFENLHVPSTLISFAVAAADARQVISPEWKRANAAVLWIAPYYEDGLPQAVSQKACFRLAERLIKDGEAVSAYTPGVGGLAAAVVKMGLGNGLGFAFEPEVSAEELEGLFYGSFILELAPEISTAALLADCQKAVPQVQVRLLGHTTAEYTLTWGREKAELAEVEAAYDSKLASVYPVRPGSPAAPAVPAAAGKQEKAAERAGVPEPKHTAQAPLPLLNYAAKSWPRPKLKTAKPRVLIPVFPGTNCEYDTARKFREAGAEPRIFVIHNLSADAVTRSVRAAAAEIAQAQIIFLPGGFSGGDEPDGSGKFITAFFRNPRISDQVSALLARDGLIGGICNGFQALIKLGLVPYGEIREMEENTATLTYNEIGRHQSRLVRTRIASNLSPWLRYTQVGEIHLTPVSHGEGRFVCPADLLTELINKGQIATQYVDLKGQPTMDIDYNPNGSLLAVEGITSPDGRVFGKMGHSERWSTHTFKNVAGNQDNGMFRAAVDYFAK